MVERLNYNEMKRALQDYIDGGDFSHPFVMFGWSAVGKTALVDEVLKANGLYSHYTPNASPARFKGTDDKLKGEKSNRIKSLSEIDAIKEERDFIDYLEVSHDKPVIIEQTYQSEDFLKLFEDVETTVHVLDFDREQWLKWVRRSNGSEKVVELLKELPLEQVHRNYASCECKSQVFPTPAKWAKIATAFEELDNMLSQMGYASAVVFDFLEKYINEEKSR